MTGAAVGKRGMIGRREKGRRGSEGIERVRNRVL